MLHINVSPYMNCKMVDEVGITIKVICDMFLLKLMR